MLDSLANEGDTAPKIRAEERPRAVKLVATFCVNVSLDEHDIWTLHCVLFFLDWGRQGTDVSFLLDGWADVRVLCCTKVCDSVPLHATAAILAY